MTNIVHLPNPRVEREEHYYNAKHQKLLDLGLQPHYLGDTLIESVIDIVERHASRVDPVELEQPNVDWRRGGTAGWRKPLKKAAADRDASHRPVVVSSKSPSSTIPLRGTEKERRVAQTR